jgi:hypothetical protein
VRVVLVEIMMMTGGESYVEASHSPVDPGHGTQTKLSRQRLHVVEKRNEAWSFHQSPSPFSRQIETRLNRRLALRVVVDEPLHTSRDGEELPEVVDEDPVLARRRKQSWNEHHHY